MIAPPHRCGASSSKATPNNTSTRSALTARPSSAYSPPSPLRSGFASPSVRIPGWLGFALGELGLAVRSRPLDLSKARKLRLGETMRSIAKMLRVSPALVCLKLKDTRSRIAARTIHTRVGRTQSRLANANQAIKPDHPHQEGEHLKRPNCSHYVRRGRTEFSVSGCEVPWKPLLSP